MIYFIAGLYLLGFVVLIAACLSARRASEDKQTVGQWYALVCESLAKGEKAADRAEAALKTLATIQRANGSPAPIPSHRPPCHP